MKAIICTKYGSPDVLQLQEVARPTPKENEALIKIHAASVTPSDCAFMKGDPFIVRLLYGLRRPKHAITGVELAGEVEAVGSAVSRFKPGDQIFGMSPNTFGAHAEYICLPEDAPLTHLPANASYAEAVGVCDGATTALTFLRDKAEIQPGQKVLVNGASGAVGIYAVQLAKYFGAEVTGVCSTSNVDMVREAGADYVIDYTREDFTSTNESYDVIFDAVGKSSFSRCKRALTERGVYLSTVPSLGIVLQMLRTLRSAGKRAVFATAGLLQNRENLDFLRQLVEAGRLRAIIDRRYPLEQAAEAHRYVDKGHKKGNVVLTMAA